MSDKLRDALESAAKEGLVEHGKVASLHSFLLARNVAHIGADDTDVELNPNEESEMPRFIRGYHDVLITIGVVITLVAISGLWSVMVVLPVSILMAEVFVKRQRLALPSFVLTLACLISTTFIALAYFDESSLAILDAQAVGGSDSTTFFVAGSVLAVMALFYWRYRVPVAFAGLIVAAVFSAAGLLYWALPSAMDNSGMIVLPLMGVVLMGIAISYDLRDPTRVTTRSDIAFWLYLVAVPMILRAFFYALDPAASTASAVTMVAAVALMMVLGLVLDRRAFVTAGLIYLGYAFSTLLANGTRGWFSGLEGTSQYMWIFLAVGVVVLGFGVGWRLWRRLLIGLLPQRVLSRLPQIR